MALIHIKENVNGLLRKMSVESDSIAVFKVCESELGNIKNMVTIAGKKNSILYLKVKNHVCLQELRLRRRELIKKINNSFGEELIKEIKIIHFTQ